jgi:hypothetical protein
MSFLGIQEGSFPHTLIKKDQGLDIEGQVGAERESLISDGNSMVLNLTEILPAFRWSLPLIGKKGRVWVGVIISANISLLCLLFGNS